MEDALAFLLGASKQNVRKFLQQYLISKKYKIHQDWLYLICYKETGVNVLLNAHYDVRQPNHRPFAEQDGIVKGNNGLGADDRAGIYALLKIIETVDVKYILLTDSEEIQARGCNAFLKKHGNDLKPNFVFTIDNENGMIYNMGSSNNSLFKKFIEDYGFMNVPQRQGWSSEINYICPVLGCSGANVSAGYLNEHRKDELLNLEWLLFTVTQGERLLKDKRCEQFYPHKE
jgi:hypothetical protein